MKQYYKSIFWGTQCYRYIRMKQLSKVKRMLRLAAALFVAALLCCGPKCDAATETHTWVYAGGADSFIVEYDPTSVIQTQDGKEALVRMVEPDNSFCVILYEVNDNMQLSRVNTDYVYDSAGNCVRHTDIPDTWNVIMPGSIEADLAETIIEQKVKEK